MQKNYTSIGLMSGTSGDGVDASIIYSDGINQYEVLKDKYFEYDTKIHKNIHLLKENISNPDDLIKYNIELRELERAITIFHAKVVKEINPINQNPLIGFHGQTIYHNSEKKISKQLGDGKLLNQLTQKKIIFNFRENDILNGGEGAPLSPIFHQLLTKQKKIKLPVCVLNIGGISNVTIVKEYVNPNTILSKDIGPGNCLIDNWIRKNSDKKFDTDGQIALSGKKNDVIFEQAQELYANRINKNKKSFDTNDFDISFSRGLSLEDGAITLTEFTASIIAESLYQLNRENKINEIIICGGGRKNKTLLKSISNNLHVNTKVSLIDDYGVDGDFIESQAFAFLAIRSYKKLPISFPNTTDCRQPCIGGEIIEN
tara:strand:+ start:9857 stop:10972 length:1116 start_codon:yes stop_codon:yes gene_type:complete